MLLLVHLQLQLLVQSFPILEIYEIFLQKLTEGGVGLLDCGVFLGVFAEVVVVEERLDGCIVTCLSLMASSLKKPSFLSSTSFLYLLFLTVAAEGGVFSGVLLFSDYYSCYIYMSILSKHIYFMIDY